MSSKVMTMGVAAAFAVLSGCGGAPQEDQHQSALTGLALEYQGISGNQVSADCAQPKASPGTLQDWKWRVVGVPSDFVPVVLKADGVEAGGLWRAAAVTRAGDTVELGSCDTIRHWPLVFLPNHNPNNDTNTYSLWTEPLHAGDPRAASTFTVYFADSAGNVMSATGDF